MLPLKGNTEKSTGVLGGRWSRVGSVVSAVDYTDAEVTAALYTHRVEVFRYELHRIVAGHWTVIADVTGLVKKCHLKYDGNGEHFMWSATFEIEDDAHTINFLTDAIRVFHLLKMPDGNYVQWMRGTFYVPSPTIPMVYGPVRTVETQDALRTVFEAKITDWFKIPSPPPGGGFDDGDPLAWARKLISDRFPLAGIDISPNTTIRVGDDPPPAPARNRSKIYEVGTSVLDVVNSLLLFCGYEILHVDGTGSLISHPFVKASARPVDWTYTANTASLIVRESGETTQDLWDAPNQWLRVVSRPDAPLLRSRLTIIDPANPLSTVYRGRVVTDFAMIDAPDQATLDTVVQALYEDGQRVLKSLKIRTPIMPHGHQDKIVVQWSTTHPWNVDGNGVYIVYGYEFDCEPGAEASLYCELAPFSPAVTGSPGDGTTTVTSTPQGISIGMNGVGAETTEYAIVAPAPGAYMFSAADPALGTETTIVATTSVTDAGSGTTLAITFTGLVADSGAGTETVAIANTAVADSGIGSETVTAGNPFSQTDSGSGLDQVTHVPPVTTSNSGSGEEGWSTADTTARVSQEIIETVEIPSPDAILSQGDIEVIEVPSPDARISQGDIEVVIQ
jgi:hypothetical protein